MEHFALIQVIVEDLCLSFISHFHGFQTALFLQPFEYLAADIDSVARRSIEERACLRLYIVAHDRRCLRKNVLADQVFPDDHDDNAGRSDIFLDASVDHAVFCDIHRF